MTDPTTASTLASGLVVLAEVGSVHFTDEFRLGDSTFEIGLCFQGQQRGDYYLRASHPIQYPDRSCTQACHRTVSHDYHHYSCPVVQLHFYRHGCDLNEVLGTSYPGEASISCGGLRYQRYQQFHELSWRDGRKALCSMRY